MRPRILEAFGPLAWRRLAARGIDLLWLVPSGWLAARVLHAVAGLGLLWQAAVAATCISCLQLIVEPAFLAAIGATPGKIILGLRLRSSGEQDNLSYAAAVSRTLKVLARGFGFWFAPFTSLAAIVLAASAFSSAGRFAWDVPGSGKVVTHPQARRLLSSLEALLLACVPGLLIPFTGAWVAISASANQSVDVGQAISRALTGRWHWLHPLTGAVVPLESEWRIIQSRLASTSFQTVLSFGASGKNQVRLDLDWVANPRQKDPCFGSMYDVELEGFLLLDRAADQNTCVSSGGRPAHEGVQRILIDTQHNERGRCSIMRIFESGDARAKRQVSELGAQLIEQCRQLLASSDAFKNFYWRNELTGRVVSIPMHWQFIQRQAHANGFITYEFGRFNSPDLADPFIPPLRLYLYAFPRHSWGGAEDALEGLESLLTHENGARAVRAALPDGQLTSTIVHEDRSVRLRVRESGSIVWILVWESPSESELDALGAELVEIIRQSFD